MPHVIPIPEEALLSTKAATQWLKDTRLVRGRHSDKVGAILAEIDRGSRFVQKKIEAVFPEFERPQIALLFGENNEPLPGQWNGHFEDRNLIGVTATNIQTLAAQNFKTIYTVKRGDTGDVINRVKPKDNALLFGVEESHHASYLQQYGNQPRCDQSLSTAEYDAIPIEFAALEFKVQHAQVLSLPQITTRVLEQRLENARKVQQATQLDIFGGKNNDFWNSI